MPKQNTGSFVPSQLRDKRSRRLFPFHYLPAVKEGLSNGETYAQIGARIGRTRQRVGQIVAGYPKLLARKHNSLVEAKLSRLADRAKAISIKEESKVERDRFEAELIDRLKAGESGHSMIRSGAITRGKFAHLLRKHGLQSPHCWWRVRKASI